MVYQKQNESLRGAWVKKGELTNGTKAKITTETNPEPSMHLDKEGNPQIQDVCLVKFEGQLEEVKVALNKVTIGALVDAFGGDSKDWIGKELTVETEKTRIAGKAGLALYLIPQGFHKYDDDKGYVKIGINGKAVFGGVVAEGVDAPAEDEPLPF